MSPRAGLNGCGKSRRPPPSSGIRSPEDPACSELLYRLSYPGPFSYLNFPPKLRTLKLMQLATSLQPVTVLFRAFAHTPAKPEPGPTPAPDAM